MVSFHVTLKPVLSKVFSANLDFKYLLVIYPLIYFIAFQIIIVVVLSS